MASSSTATGWACEVPADAQPASDGQGHHEREPAPGAARAAGRAGIPRMIGTNRDSGLSRRARPSVGARGRLCWTADVNLATIIDPHPDAAVAVISRGKSTTYGDLRRQVAGLRGGLSSLGLEPGDRVGIVAANNWYFVVSYLAVLGAGLVAVPLNPTSPVPEIERELAAIGARAVIAGPKAKAIVGELDRSRLPALEHVIASEGGDISGARPARRPAGGRAGAGRRPGADDLAVLIFTSGTAGSPKAAMLTHGNLLANLEQCQAHPGRQQGADDVVFGVLPLFHIFGLNVVLGPQLRGGRHGAAHRAVRPAVGPRVRGGPRRHRDQRRAHHVGGVGGAAGRAGRRLRHGAAGHVGRRQARPGGRAGDPAALRPRPQRGLRPHRGVAGRHVRHRARGARGQHRRAAARRPGAARRPQRRRRARRRRRRDLGAGPERVRRLLGGRRRHRHARSPPTAGCAPATWPWSTTTASSSSSTA